MNLINQTVSKYGTDSTSTKRLNNEFHVGLLLEGCVRAEATIHNIPNNFITTTVERFTALWQMEISESDLTKDEIEFFHAVLDKHWVTFSSSLSRESINILRDFYQDLQKAYSVVFYK